MRNFSGVPLYQFTGSGINLPVNPAASSKENAAIVGMTIDWTVPWQAAGQPAVVGVAVDLKGQSYSGNQLSAIRSIKIDNTGSTVPIYVYFNDTQDTVTCPPMTVVIQPCYTNVLNCIVVAAGLTPGYIPKTRILFSNIQLPSTVDPEMQLVFPQWVGSPTVQRSNTITPGYGPPALGDQTVQYHDACQVIGGVVRSNLWGTPYSSGFIYLTHVDFTMVDWAASGAQTCVIQIRPGDLSGHLYEFYIVAGRSTKILNFSGMNIRLDATKTWQLYQVNYTGDFMLYLQHAYNYTYSTT